MTSSNNYSDIHSHLRDEALRLRERYDTSSLADLERIAKEEYGAGVHRTIIAYKQPVTIGKRNGEKRDIFYYSLLKGIEPLCLAHEIGHLAAGHFDGRNSNEEEREAKYFVFQLTGVSRTRQNLSFIINGLSAVLLIPIVPFFRSSEIKRLKKMGVSDDVIAII